MAKKGRAWPKSYFKPVPIDIEDFWLRGDITKVESEEYLNILGRDVHPADLPDDTADWTDEHRETAKRSLEERDIISVDAVKYAVEHMLTGSPDNNEDMLDPDYVDSLPLPKVLKMVTIITKGLTDLGK